MQNDISSKQVFFFILKALKSFKIEVGIWFINDIVWAVSLSLQPYIVKVILNRINDLPKDQVIDGLIWPVIAYISVSFALMCMFRIYDYFIDIRLIPSLYPKISNSSFESLLKQSHSYYQGNFAGSLANKVNDLSIYVCDILKIAMDNFLPHILGISIAIYTLWQVNVSFALATLIWSILFISCSIGFSRHLSTLSDVASEIHSTITGKLVDSFSNILSVRLFARAAHEKCSLDKSLDDEAVAQRKIGWFYFWMWFVSGYSFVAIQGINIYFLINGLKEGWVTAGDFALVLTINIAIVDCLWNTTKDFSKFSKAYGKITQALRAVSYSPEIQDELGAKTLTLTKADIVFDKVKFHYKGSKPLFEDLSITIPSGQKVGLVGYSGSGKTTFVNLILRIYDLSAGSIRIDGQDISAVTQDSLRRNIAMIPQDPSLFHRSLMENIRYGKVESRDQEVISAAVKAHAHEFIAALPEGYEALVGERGVKLSGGQRQRIAIARAILKNAPILILDEATSQLDSITENYIQESISQLMSDKTTIIVAHRLSTLLSMDRILVFDNGKIVEDGNHTSLMILDGLYK
jgi:ATP-binding cassette subfamily B protein